MRNHKTAKNKSKDRNVFLRSTEFSTPLTAETVTLGILSDCIVSVTDLMNIHEVYGFSWLTNRTRCYAAVVQGACRSQAADISSQAAVISVVVKSMLFSYKFRWRWMTCPLGENRPRLCLSQTRRVLLFETVCC